MTDRDCICGPFDIDEKNGHSASCNRYNRKRETDTAKQAQKKAQVKSVKRVSDKMAKELTIYAKKKEKHLADHPDCQIKIDWLHEPQQHHTPQRLRLLPPSN